MKKGKRIKKLVCCLLCCTLLAGMSVSVYASTSINLSGYKYYSGYKATTYMKGTITWPTAIKAKFKGTTGGRYYGSKVPSKVTHTDIITATGIGSVSVSGSDASVSVSGSTATYKYTASKSKVITNDVSYLISKGITFKVTVTSATTFTWSSYNLRVIPGDKG